MRFKGLILSCLCTLAIGLAVSAGASAAPRSFYGVVPQTALTGKEIDRMGKGRIGTLRTIMSWSAIDPTKADGDYNWGSFDGLMIESARNDIRALPFVYGTPRWVAKLDRRRCGASCDAFAPRRKPALRAWRTFLADAVARYGRGGELWDEHPQLRARPIRAWQIWNEQNSSSFYRPKPSPRAYAKLLDASAKALRSEDRSADLVLGGMAELAGSRKAVRATDYLRDLYRVPGVERDFDGVATHPYGARVASIREQVESIRRVITGAGDGAAGLSVTELGWGSASGGHPLNRGRAGQAARLSQSYRWLRSNRGRLNVQTVAWFSWRDSASSICSWCASSGLFSEALAPKPSWRALTRLTGGR